MRHQPRHLKRPEPYTGWGQVTDPASQLALAQAPIQPTSWSPPRPPVQTRTLVVAGVSVIGGLVLASVLALVLILAAAIVAGSPTPAEATDTRPAQIQTVYVDGDQLKVRVPDLCPTEDSCSIDYIGRGTWVIRRETP